MTAPRGKPLDFTGASFERFQALLRGRCTPASWCWILRDGIFSTITHDPLTVRRVIRTKDGLVLVWMVQHQGFPGKGGQAQGEFKKAAVKEFSGK